jgi:hypothetical protein
MYNAQPVRRYILNCGAVATCKSSAPAQTTEAPTPSSLSQEMELKGRVCMRFLKGTMWSLKDTMCECSGWCHASPM